MQLNDVSKYCMQLTLVEFVRNVLPTRATKDAMLSWPSHKVFCRAHVTKRWDIRGSGSTCVYIYIRYGTVYAKWALNRTDCR